MACPSRDDLVGYSLGALEADEERTIEAHLPDCERCTRELRALAPAVAVLGESVEQLEPPPELRERLLATVHDEAERGAAPSPAGGERRLTRLIMRPAAGLAALALVGAGVAGYAIRDEEENAGGPETFPASEAQGAAGGSLEVSSDSAMLEVHGMPQLAKGDVYQVWVAEGSAVRPASSFVPDRAGDATAAVPEPLKTGDKVMVTREPGPDRTTPTLPAVLSARVD